MHLSILYSHPWVPNSPNVLWESRPTRDTLWQYQTRALLENVYANAPIFETGTVSLTQYLLGVFQAFGERRPIRVLELGAGTGGTTNRLVEALIITGKEFEYTFTDISASLVAAAG
ncbi:Type I Polyketide synthases (Type I PKS) [Penicillium cf. griseofulvum]|nr:Type I Polyketide synthases (Type I PKS) [Penicillium cf. griseofulvum]